MPFYINLKGHSTLHKRWRWFARLKASVRTGSMSLLACSDSEGHPRYIPWCTFSPLGEWVCRQNEHPFILCQFWDSCPLSGRCGGFMTGNIIWSVGKLLSTTGVIFPTPTLTILSDFITRLISYLPCMQSGLVQLTGTEACAVLCTAGVSIDSILPPTIDYVSHWKLVILINEY